MQLPQAAPLLPRLPQALRRLPQEAAWDGVLSHSCRPNLDSAPADAAAPLEFRACREIRKGDVLSTDGTTAVYKDLDMCSTPPYCKVILSESRV